MPRDLQSVINVVAPYGFKRIESNLEQQTGPRSRSLSTNLGPSEKCDSCNWHRHGVQHLHRLEQCGNANHFIRRHKQDNFSGLRYEFNRVCRAVGLLPNPMSRMLFEEVKERFPDKMPTMPCHHMHERYREPPCMSYYSPKPSHVLTSLQGGKVLNEVDHQRTRNLQAQAPLSTVVVFLSKQIIFPKAIEYLRGFGEIESMTQQGPRSFRVVFSNLLSACEAVRHSDHRFIQCSWYHRGLAERRFIRRKKQALHVVTVSSNGGC